MNQQKNGEPNLNRNSTNMHGCYTAYQRTSAVPSNIHPVNLVPNSEELASSKQLYQYYMQSRQYPMEQGMHNHVYGNPPSTPLPTENYLPVPDFKLLKFPSVFPGIKVVDGCLGISSGPSNTPPFSPSIPDDCYIPSIQMLGDNASTQIDAISQHGLVAWPPQDFGPGISLYILSLEHRIISFFLYIIIIIIIDKLHRHLIMIKIYYQKRTP